MANTKTYTVMKDGETIRELKSLPAAKKLADAEEAEVFCEGLCVYTPDPPVTEDKGITEAFVETAEEADAAVETDTPVAEKVEQPGKSEKPEKPTTKYTLLRKMNVRREPSLKAEKLKVLDTGAVVEVQDIRNDWLCLTNGSFILFEGGKNARKV